ncbi:MAG: acyloxyacyl hydrolase [Rhodobacteraceae bacterium]|nr:acyloxyacyl hydrolase [Paracoccaceae bacterium]
MGAGWSPLAQAETLIFGVGHTRFSDDNADDFPIFSLELQRDPFKSVGGWDFGLGGAVSIDTNGDGHLGLGLYAIYHTKSQWFFETSVMPGVYFNGSSDNWLGGHFQIRSLLALGYDLNAPNSISLAVTHISNASTRDFNPGVNALWLRWHLRF